MSQTDIVLPSLSENMAAPLAQSLGMLDLKRFLKFTETQDLKKLSVIHYYLHTQ